mgnify:FL=1
MIDAGQDREKNSEPSDSKEHSPLLASLTCSGLVTILLFCLLPLSQFVRGDDWMVREVDWVDVPEPPRKKPVIEKKLEEELEKAPKPPDLLPPRPVLDLESLETSMEVGPGDFRTAFAITDFDLAPGEIEGDFVFKLHELDRVPGILKRGRLRYPSALLRRNLEGKVRLLVVIDERGSVKVRQVVESTHEEFIEPSIKAAEESIYEPPMRNGERVKVQFYLPLEFKISNQ